MDKKTVKIKYIGFWDGFNEEDNFIINVLKKKYNVAICDDADYAFVSVFDDTFSYLKFDGIRIFYSGENMPVDFAVFDYGISFDRMEFGDRYLRYPIGLKYVTQKSEKKDKSIIESKDFFALFMYRHEGIPYRTELFNKLSEYKHVVSPGKYLNNSDIVVPHTFERVAQIEFESKAKFVIACENVSFPGYVTEKLDIALAAHSVPIYYGDPTVCDDYNPNAIINCMDYSTVDEVVNRVKEIDQNDDLYLKMINEQPYNDINYVERKKEELEEFLFNIFDQDYDHTFRRQVEGDWNPHKNKESLIINYLRASDEDERLKNENQRLIKRYNRTIPGFLRRCVRYCKRIISK